MKRSLIVIFLLICSLGSYAQAAHSVTLTWTDAQNPAGTTYNVKRAIGLCTGTPTFTTIASALTTKTYNDATVTVGNYCYVVTAVLNGAESVPSNSAQANVPPFPPTALTFTVQ
jgi:hypothetical protein